jgi:hypothetical protein
MKAHAEEKRTLALELLRNKRSLNEISKRTGILPATVEDWAADWRRDGTLTEFKRDGAAFTARAKAMSNGYYPILRKRYLGMRWCDKLAGREFGFNNIIEAIPYYLDEKGVPRICAYCGLVPPEGKVWGLDRIDSSIGHVPGNLLPCCSYHIESSKLACQQSKSKFSLFNWLQANLSRAYGYPVPTLLVEQRVKQLKELAVRLAALAAEKEI